MSWSGIEGPTHPVPRPFYLVGFGNQSRRDDGLGPWVARKLARETRGRTGIHCLFYHQLTPELAEDLAEAGTVVLVDVTVEHLPAGRSWHRVEPEPWPASALTHRVTAGYILWIMKEVYHRQPLTWLISVQGEDFGFGTGLSPQAGARARVVVEELAGILSKEE
jgi:hydrogenase maturation protease